MSCYHPMILINTSEMIDPKQREIVEKLKIIHSHDDRFKSASTILIPRELAENEGITLRESKAVLVPCGRCIGCRLDYSRQWAERCVHEAEQYENNYFLTLTYDDDHLPIGSKGVPTLVQDEISDFMKSFREVMRTKYNFTGIRFFACAEYGDLSLRPHYHIILFNCPIPDLQERHPIPVAGQVKWIRQYDSDGSLLMYSPLIGKIWSKGTAQIGLVSYESCAYVARYVVKKQYGKESKQYKDVDVVPPYVRMSRMPGIGQSWYLEHLDRIYTYDSVTFKRGDRVISQKPGKYCDRLLKSIDEDLFYSIKKGRTIDFYDSIDCKTYEFSDLATNNKRAEALKIASAKALKRLI